MIRSSDVRMPKAFRLDGTFVRTITCRIRSMVTLGVGPVESDAIDLGRRPPAQVKIVNEIRRSGYEVVRRVDYGDPIEG